MSGQLFKKAACFTDLHVGHKQNSELHLKDCERFLDWFIAEARASGAETCIFLGDWMHSRSTINVKSMNASVSFLKKLCANFEDVYFITGNHDLFYRDKRDLNSVEYARDFPNLHLIDEMLVKDDVVITPWLVGDEWKTLKKQKAKYIFGHLELPHFLMNAMIEMPDSGQLRVSDFGHVDYVFSGHFHARQSIGNTYYIGNAFPHNFSDVGDFERGMMLLEWDKEPEFLNWADCPKYVSCTLSELLENHESLLDQYTHAKVKVDIDITYEESTIIRDEFYSMYNFREMRLIAAREEVEEQEGGDINFETVDQTVLSQIDTIESEVVNNETLKAMYLELEIDS